MRTFTSQRLAGLLALLVITAFVIAQGPLTPLGAPGPTMKTLDQIEPRKEVNATNTPGNATSLFTINAPGSYYLSGNITGVSGKYGIRIFTSGVTLDLNGFEVRGVAGSLDGISAFGGAQMHLRNGTIRGWGGNGVDLSAVSTVENVRSRDNGSAGFTVNGGSFLRECIASQNTGDGFSSFSSGGSIEGVATVFENCVANSNGGDGFRLVTSASLHNCVAELSGGDGISAGVSYSVTATNCTIVLNTGSGISVAGSSTLTACTAESNKGVDGIFAGDGSTVTNCTARDNIGTYGIRAGVGSTLTNCTAHSNDVEFGIDAGDRSTLSNCTASLNTSALTDSWGIRAGAQCTVSQCGASGNLNTNGIPSASTGGGIVAGNGSTVQHCTVAANKGDGIRVFADSRVVANTCDSNGFPVGTGVGAGVHATSGDNRIEANNVTDNTRGIDVDTAGNLIIKNSAAGNAPNYEIAANNVFGAIVDRTAPASAAVSGNAAPSSAVTTDPWANFAY